MPQRGPITPDATVTLAQGVVSTQIPDEVVILDSAGDRYFSLQGSGPHIWQRLQSGPITVNALIESVVEAYDVDRATAARDTVELLDDLLDRELVSIGSVAA